jgi:hypothetical protein
LRVLPADWSSGDVGTVGLAGSANFCGSTFTVKGAGSDIGGTADSFQFAYTTLTNSGEIIARWASAQPGGTADKVGLMMRETTAPNSRTVALLYDESSSFNRVRMPRRTTTGGSMSYPGPDGPTGTSVPLWLRLARTNDIFTGYVSTNGADWMLVTAAIKSGTPATLLVRMGVCSRITNSLNISTFDGVSVSGVWPPPVSLSPPLLSSLSSDSQLQLSWPETHIGWRLEAQTNSLAIGIGTNWFTVSGSSMTNQVFLPINPTNRSVFLRLVYP